MESDAFRIQRREWVRNSNGKAEPWMSTEGLRVSHAESEDLAGKGIAKCCFLMGSFLGKVSCPVEGIPDPEAMPDPCNKP